MGDPELRQITRAEFCDRLDELVAIYAAALQPPESHLPGRRAIMERHAAHPAFTCWLAGSVAFAYGFHGARHQWWHDVVHQALHEKAGTLAARRWLRDSFEIAEIHVHPDWQARGIGRNLIHALTRDRPERTAVLSTHDSPSPARRLYRSLGFGELLTGFVFPGGDQPFVIMGTRLPLKE